MTESPAKILLRKWQVHGRSLVISLTGKGEVSDLDMPLLHDAVKAFVGTLAARSEGLPPPGGGGNEGDQGDVDSQGSVTAIRGLYPVLPENPRSGGGYT